MIPAAAPEQRTVTVKGQGRYVGWEVTARVDFPAIVLEGLQSGDVPMTLRAMDGIVTEHNLPDVNGELAASMLDVSPWQGAYQMVGLVIDAMVKLPNP